MPVDKERVSVTLTEPYLAFLDHQVQRGVHVTRGSVIREALRLLMRRHGVHLSPEEVAGW